MSWVQTLEKDEEQKQAAATRKLNLMNTVDW